MSSLLPEQNGATQHRQDWQQALINAITDPLVLCQQLDLDPQLIFGSEKCQQQFPLRVPLGFVSRMKKGDPKDPLLLQVLLNAVELNQTPGFARDPLQEKQKQINPIPGLLHKYQGRVLLIIAGDCAIHCRYCFRRHFPYNDNNPGTLEKWKPAWNYIAQDPSIEEIIFSGGDPLVHKDQSLKQLIDYFALIPHVKRLRIHTRIPIVLPERITPSLMTALTSNSLQLVVVVHCNHAQEIDSTVGNALQKLREANITLLNQAVLLKDINDQVDILVELSKKLFAHHVLPYYLHLLDPVTGAAHFDVAENRAKTLHQGLQNSLPGYLVPKLVREVAGAKAKQLVLG